MRKKGRSLSGNSDFFQRKNLDPMEGVSNLSDVMLVFACGLMLALIVNYHVDLELFEVDQSSMNEVNIEDYEVVKASANASASDSGYAQVGTVYEDPASGKMYLITG